MKKIIFDFVLVKQNNLDVIKLTAKEGSKEVSTYFNPPNSKQELIVDLTATLNSLMDELYKKYGQFI